MKMQWTDLRAAILKYDLQILRNVSDYIYMKQLHQNQLGNVEVKECECQMFGSRRQE